MLKKKSRSSSTNSTSFFNVVGVGASAGGLEAFSALVKALNPKINKAFIFVQHLDRTHESLLVPLLSHLTEIKVLAIADKMILEPNRIYVLPPNFKVKYIKGMFRLLPREESANGFCPIDFLFASLALECKERAISVLLSGTGSDGAKGTALIKAAGGLTFAEDEESAKYPDMPISASRGGVDCILSPTDIGRHLSDLSDSIEGINPDLAISESDLNSILRVVMKSRLVDFSQYKNPSVKRRMLRRMKFLNVASSSKYLAYLDANPNETEILYEDILIKVTEFFRYPQSFDVLKDKVFLPILSRSVVPASIRVWVPGCATGEEVYSIAMLLIELQSEARTSIRAEFFATDISDDALAVAKKGVYEIGKLKNLSNERVKRFFVEEEGRFRIVSEVRNSIVFSKQDVSQDTPFSNLDLVSCRNLLIYFSLALQDHVLSAFHFALHSDGFLLLGSAESISQYHRGFEIVDKRSKLFSKIALPFDARILSFSGSGRPTKYAKIPLLAGKPISEVSLSDLKVDADRVIQSRFEPPGVVINGSMEVVQFRGDTSDFLLNPTGNVTNNLFNLCREGLLSDLRFGIKEATTRHEMVTKLAWLQAKKKKAKRVQIHILPFNDSKDNVQFYVVLFVYWNVLNIKSAQSYLAENVESRSLTQQYEDTKDYLKSVIDREYVANEQLKAASEELLSRNQELHSTNQEMAAAREEIQAANEELLNVNEALNRQFAELSRVNNDLVNLFGVANIPLVVFSNQLAITRFCQAAGSALNITTKDIGKPLSEISSRLSLENLDHLVAQVVHSSLPIELEVQDKKGHWYSLRIRRYLNEKNIPEGAVLAMVDIDPMMRNLERLRESYLYAESIIETMPIPILMLDIEFKVVTGTAAFCRLFSKQMKALKNTSVYDLGWSTENIVILRHLLEEVLPEKYLFESVDIECEMPILGRRLLQLNGRRLEQKFEKVVNYFVSIEDVTEKKSIEAKILESKNIAEAASRSKSEFLANMSHEIRTPLGIILGSSELLANPVQSRSESIQYVVTIQKQVEQLTQIIDEILDISKIEAGKLTVERVWFSFVGELSETFRLMQERSLKKGVQFDVVFAEKVPTFINSCPMRLRQVLLNIMGNAIKFTSDGKIKVSVFLKDCLDSLSGQFLCFLVEDTGCGLSVEESGAIFKPFSQADSSITRKFGGTGLGLSLSKHLALALGGDVTMVQSTPGLGSTFLVAIDPGIMTNVPMHKNLLFDDLIHSESSPDDVFQANGVLAGMRVLLVDDGPENCELMQHFLSLSGALVDVATNGEEAVARARIKEYHVILMDMQMPILDGYEATRLILAEQNKLAIIALTANAMQTEREACLAAGCVDFLSKPVKASLLISIVSKYKKLSFFSGDT